MCFPCISFTGGILQSFERTQITQLLQITHVVFHHLICSVSLFDHVSGALLSLLLVLLLLFGRSLLFFRLIFLVQLRCCKLLGETAFALFSPLLRRVEDRTLWRGHIAKDEGNARLLLSHDNGFASFLIEGLGNTILIHESSFIHPKDVEGPHLKESLRIGDLIRRSGAIVIRYFIAFTRGACRRTRCGYKGHKLGASTFLYCDARCCSVSTGLLFVD
mmetsp:Transcript_22872/g.34329  ORF Transcript_22872/g.34329 Transcript_22872/m.34329 type:complete len:218 (-) Transcript_22872:7-660(-)